MTGNYLLEETGARKLIYAYMKEKYVVQGALSEPCVPEWKHRRYLNRYLREVVRARYPDVLMGRCQELAREMLPGVIEERKEYVAQLAEREVEDFERNMKSAEPIVEKGGCLNVEFKKAKEEDLRRIAAMACEDVMWTDREVIEKIREGNAGEVYGPRFQRRERAA